MHNSAEDAGLQRRGRSLRQQLLQQRRLTRCPRARRPRLITARRPRRLRRARLRSTLRRPNARQCQDLPRPSLLSTSNFGITAGNQMTIYKLRQINIYKSIIIES